jgi:predicted lipoprotein with Yx(FWY)xxD motif
MRKSGWTAATGIGSLVLLLAACGGSSPSTSAAGSGSSAGQPSSGSSGPVAPASSVSPVATTTKSAKGSKSSSPATPSPKPHHTAGPQPSSNAGDQSIPATGTTVMIVQHSNLGYVLAEANGQVVYTYSKDKKGGPATCTGSCASKWPPATGTPQAGPADHFPGTFTVVKGAGGVQQIAYKGMPLYTFAGAKPYSTAGNGTAGVWHVVPLSADDISTS